MAKTSIDHFKRTKMLATVGPSTNSLKKIEELVEAGANGFRLNFSHGTHEEKAQHIKWIRTTSAKFKKPIAILADLQGPKIRCGDLKQPIEVHKGDKLQLQYNGKESEGMLPVQYDLSPKVKIGHNLMIFDGKIRTVVTAVRGDVVHVEVKNHGFIMSRKGINLPDTDLKGDIITSKDREDLRFALEHGADYIALSFVQSANDVERLKGYISKFENKALVIAKVETKQATEKLGSIVRASDGVMVARGDLAIETEPESVPIVQRKIIGLCQEHGKISIVATQMLASMTENPEPTRAEVSDVATAVIVGADCVMLSDETASGDYPIESVQFMKRIITYTEENSPLRPVFYKEEDKSIQSALSSAVMTLAHQVSATAIVTETGSGDTARSLASHRPGMPIIMVTPKQQVAQQLALVYGGKSFVRKVEDDAGERMTDWLREKKILRRGDIVIITSGKYPGIVGGTDTIKVRRIV